ncbi:hypothetical protein PIB30_046411 [Stylosanthes scabra]|uniref:Uncharacterized protein n=1 Tax=Stylosanthes scabra TaxID=79078 RepID=A0ABU6TGU7_9FABA|nr:hypothetical protein [Stylosanthes scabra]
MQQARHAGTHLPGMMCTSPDGRRRFRDIISLVLPAAGGGWRIAEDPNTSWEEVARARLCVVLRSNNTSVDDYNYPSSSVGRRGMCNFVRSYPHRFDSSPPQMTLPGHRCRPLTSPATATSMAPHSGN